MTFTHQKTNTHFLFVAAQMERRPPELFFTTEKAFRKELGVKLFKATLKCLLRVNSGILTSSNSIAGGTLGWQIELNPQSTWLDWGCRRGAGSQCHMSVLRNAHNMTIIFNPCDILNTTKCTHYPSYYLVNFRGTYTITGAESRGGGPGGWDHSLFWENLY